MGTYPRNQAEYPVGGISWYEAAAYAEFREKALPTVYHWSQAANIRLSRYIILASNFNETGSTPVGQGISACGAYDMAGNVREWCFNESGAERCILGGGWNDQPYSFNDLYAQLPLDRSPTNGVRCMKILNPVEDESRAYAPIKIAFRDFMKERPVADEVYRQYLSFYAYDRSPLHATIESTDSTDEWICQKVSLDAAYGGERMMVYLFLPRDAELPLQTIVFFPGSQDIYDRSSDPHKLIGGIDFIVKSGRALAYPILKGTFERGSKLNTDYPNETVLWRDHVVAWAKDIGRTIDYLETRPDIDTSKIAYFGWSWGGMMGAIMPAIERRFKVAVLNVAGFSFNKTLPEVDAINFVGHITMPVLMLNGRYDYYFPYETSQLPMFKLLGTPPDQKKQVVYETSHFLPRNQLIREILAWLDRYLGDVELQVTEHAT
jgi:pimeloyl-ACP methyl ester carboxylesterase